MEHPRATGVVSQAVRAVTRPSAATLSRQSGVTVHADQAATRSDHRPTRRGIDRSQPAAIVIPDSAKEKPQQGKVIAAGNGRYTDEGTRVPLDVKAGDLILFGKYSGQEITLDGEEYLVMREDEVLAALNGASPLR